MKINNFKQNFGANIIINDSFKKALNATRQANNLGCFNQTAQFINAVQAIKDTDQFDTFEIEAQSLEDGAKAGYTTTHPFEIKIDGKPYDCKNIKVESFFGEHQASRATSGIIGFAKEFFGSDFNQSIGGNHEKYNQICADIKEHERQISLLKRDVAWMQNAAASEYEIKLNKLI